jgi:hypothetical protein
MQKLIAATPHLNDGDWTLIAVTVVVDGERHHGIVFCEQDGRDIEVSYELGQVGFDVGSCWDDNEETKMLEDAIIAANALPVLSDD